MDLNLFCFEMLYLFVLVSRHLFGNYLPHCTWAEHVKENVPWPTKNLSWPTIYIGLVQFSVVCFFLRAIFASK